MERDYAVLVIGGGAAGICAAIQAARAGARTLLVERSARLGGTTVNALVDFPGLFHAWGKQVIAGIGWELVARSCREGGVALPDFTKPAVRHMHHQVRVPAPLYSLLAAEAVQEAGVETLLHTMVARVREEENGVCVELCTKSGIQGFRAQVLIDCTADANALALAGCALRVPQEVQPGTLCCRAGGYRFEELDQEAIRAAAKEAHAKGELFPCDLSFSPVELWPEGWLFQRGDNCNHLYGVNAIDSEGRSRMEGLGVASLLRVFRFLKRQPGLEQLTIEALAVECGVRETATLIGQDTITAEDYCSGKVWPDALCYSFYPIDLHDKATGLDNRKLQPGVVPTIGRGALLPAGHRRLLGAGRCLSSDRLANSALRVQASCMAMGQATGALAALAVADATLPEAVDLNKTRQLLVANGAICPLVS